jgi:hypothetical protein
MKGFYRMPVVKAAREHNAEDWKRKGWVMDMVRLLSKERYFRWFDSGDLYHPDLARKIDQVCTRTYTKHWIPTKMWDVKGLLPQIEALKSRPNVILRRSSKHIDDVPLIRKHTSVVMSEELYYSDSYAGVRRCPAPQQGHQCKDCRACWDKRVLSIGYLKS